MSEKNSGSALGRLGALLEAGEVDKAVRQFETIATRGTLRGHRLERIEAAFREAGQLDRFVDAVARLDMVPGTLSELGGMLRAARDAGRLDAELARIGTGRADGIALDYVDKLSAHEAKFGGDIAAILAEVKYRGITEPFAIDRLFGNAALLAPRIRVDRPAFDYLFDRRRDRAMDRAAWDAEVRFTAALVQIIYDANFSIDDLCKPVDLAPCADTFAALCGAGGAVLVTCHTGMIEVLAAFVSRDIPDVLFVGRGVEGADRIAVSEQIDFLFPVLKALMQRKNVFIGIDGLKGSNRSSVSILGKPFSLANGAAMLAFEARKPVYWCTMGRTASGFVPRLVRGPDRLKGETFADYRDRLHAFHVSVLEDIFAGHPRDIFLFGRWLKAFGDTAAAD